jgi:hypothetical protein
MPEEERLPIYNFCNKLALDQNPYRAMDEMG